VKDVGGPSRRSSSPLQDLGRFSGYGIAWALATLLLTPLPWARYYLPLAPALAMLTAQALVDLSSKLRTVFYREADGVTVLD